MRTRWMGGLAGSAAAAVIAVGISAALAGPGVKITLAGGSVGGAWSTIGAAIGETIRREAPDSSFTYEPGIDAANVVLVSEGKVQLGIAHAQMALRARKGVAPFKHKIANIEAIALVDPEAVVQMVVAKDSKIKSLSQIRQEKMPIRIALNKRGTMMAVAGEEVFKAAGITPANIVAWGGRVDYVDFNAGLSELKNGQVDLVLSMLAYPSAQVKATARDIPLRLIGIEPDLVGKIDATLGTRPETIPPEAYGFQDDPVNTVTAKAVLIAATGMPEQLAATVTKGLIDHYEYLKTAYPTFGRMGVKALPDVAPLKLHPGAAKAYQAAGLLK